MATRGPDRFGGGFAGIDPPSAEYHRVAEGGQRLCGSSPDARRSAGDDGGTACWVRGDPGHQRSVTEVGRAARPRTLMEWTLTMPSGSTS